MKRLYLYQLYRYSKSWFVITLVFVAVYALLMYKKMDMVFFPYNDMFSGYDHLSNKQELYRVKVNGQPLKITSFPYWKKDLLDVSAKKYAAYWSQGKRNRLAFYFEQPSRKKIFPQWFYQNLLPGDVAFEVWGQWYAEKCGMNQIKPNDTLSLVKYNCSQKGNDFLILDSFTIVHAP